MRKNEEYKLQVRKHCPTGASLRGVGGDIRTAVPLAVVVLCPGTMPDSAASCCLVTWTTIRWCPVLLIPACIYAACRVMQMVTWHKMFSREVRLREAMKRIIAVMWTQDVPPAATGYTANDIIIGIESGEFHAGLWSVELQIVML